MGVEVAGDIRHDQGAAVKVNNADATESSSINTMDTTRTDFNSFPDDTKYCYQRYG